MIHKLSQTWFWSLCKWKFQNTRAQLVVKRVGDRDIKIRASVVLYHIVPRKLSTISFTSSSFGRQHCFKRPRKDLSYKKREVHRLCSPTSCAINAKSTSTTTLTRREMRPLQPTPIQARPLGPFPALGGVMQLIFFQSCSICPIPVRVSGQVLK